jgi:hypothetical protein
MALRDALMDEKLVLDSIEDPAAETTADMEGVLQTVLIVVSVVLGTLVVILFAAFFIRTRRQVLQCMMYTYIIAEIKSR